MTFSSVVLSFLCQCNEAFTAFFVLEMVFKLGLLGPYAYFTDYYNIFDFTVTWLGLFEITFQVRRYLSWSSIHPPMVLTDTHASQDHEWTCG